MYKNGWIKKCLKTQQKKVIYNISKDQNSKKG